ncbi:MAG: GGDEF domain-containing protein [Lachnospiraceae bacterium]|nr:GGDEF domain-containing protein [Lachnospiraceae bacterium]
MIEKEIKRELTEKIADQSFNACICLKIQQNGDYLPVYINRAFERMFAVSQEELCSMPIQEALKLKYGQQGIEGFYELLHTLKVAGEPRMEVYYDSQREMYFRVIGFVPINGYICLILMDITVFERSREKVERMYEELSSSEEELRYQVDLLNVTQNSLEETKRVYKLVSENATDGFVYYNFQTGAVFASNKWYSIFPVSEDNVGKMEVVVSYLDEEYREDYEEQWKNAIKKKKESEKFLYQMKEDAAWISQVSWFWYDGAGAAKEVVSFYQDITYEMLQRRELEKLAYYDSFTEVHNRNFFTNWLHEQIVEAGKDISMMQMLYIDIDHFKWVNDRLGIQIADELLLKFAAIVQSYESETTKVARFSNDEFVMGIKQAYANDSAKEIAREIREKLKTPILLSNGMKYYVTVSIGIAECDNEIRSAADLIRASDLAMIESKKSGRNMITYYEPYMGTGFVGEADLEQKLQSVVEKDGFYLLYQPQYEAKTEKLRGVEALIRWHDMELGNISPALFIPIAEENGTINKIGDFVIRESLKALHKWTQEYAYEGMMSINISAIQFKDGRFLDTLQYYTGLYGLNAHKIEIELTESVFIEDLDETVKLINKIREFGYRISLDDFGTGYSSLSYLRIVPIDTLKIDRSFITELSREKNTTIITTSIIEMAEKLGLEVIAEGVEEQEQLECLRENQCGIIQGYLLGRPLRQEAIEALLRS